MDDVEAGSDDGGRAAVPGAAHAVPSGGAGAAGTTPVERRRRERRRDRWQLPRAIPLAVGVAAGLVLSQATLAVLARLRGIMLLLLLSLFLSFAIEPAVQWLHSRGIRRGLGTGLVYVLITVLGAGFVFVVSDLVVGQVTELGNSAPRLLDDLAARAEELPEGIAEPVRTFLMEQANALPERLSSSAGTVGRRALGVGTTILGGVFSLLTVALITFYLVADGPKLRRQLLRRLDPERQQEFVRLWELAIAKTGGYVYSRLVLAVVSATVHVVAFTVIGLPYAVALGVWMGIVSSVVPVIGVYVAAAVPVVVALAEPDASVVWILVVVTVYQQLENYLVQPRITAHTLSLHPAVAFVAVIVGAALLGAIGALLALPVAAIVAALISTYAEEHEVLEDHEPSPAADARRGRGRDAAPA